MDTIDVFGLAVVVTGDGNTINSTTDSSVPTPYIPECISDYIINVETGGYSNYNCHPEWPGGASGLTIGVGYDIGHRSKSDVRADLAPYLSEKNLNCLLKFVGKVGQSAKAAMKRDDCWKCICLSWTDATIIYKQATLPKYIEDARRVFPYLDYELPEIRGVVVSIVLNRGQSMSGSSRKEMRQLRDAIKNGDRKKIPSIIRNMKNRVKKGDKGLLERREREAEMVEHVVSPIIVPQLDVCPPKWPPGVPFPIGG